MQGKYRQQRVMKISITERKGILAPITENGRIIGNDIVASVYSGIKHSRLQGQFYGNVAYFQSWMRLFGESVFNQVSFFSICSKKKICTLKFPDFWPFYPKKIFFGRHKE